MPSEFQERAGFEPGFDSAVLNVAAADVAREGYRGLMANKRAVLPGLGIKIVPLVLRLVPRGFVLAAVGRFQAQALTTLATDTPQVAFLARDLL